MTMIAKTSMKEQVYSAIKQKIFDGEYQFGDTINITALCKELGVSNTPTREALSRLEAEGLVTMTLSSKVEVIRLDEKIFNEISYSFFSQIMGAFTLCQIQGKLPLLITLLEEAIEEQTASLKENADSDAIMKAIEFDRCFIRATENPTMLRNYDRQASLLYLLTHYTYDKEQHNKEQNLQQHAAILEVIKSENFAEIPQMFFEHFDKHF